MHASSREFNSFNLRWPSSPVSRNEFSASFSATPGYQVTSRRNQVDVIRAANQVRGSWTCDPSLNISPLFATSGEKLHSIFRNVRPSLGNNQWTPVTRFPAHQMSTHSLVCTLTKKVLQSTFFGAPGCHK